IALRSPVPPSIRKRSGRSRSSPRWRKSASSPWQTVAFSVVPSCSARTVLRALRIQAHGEENHVVAEVETVDEDHAEVEAVERLREPRREPGAREGNEAARDTTLRDRPLTDPGWQRVECAVVLAGRNPDRERLQRPGIEWIPAAGVGEARQDELRAVDAARPQARHADATPTEGDLAAHAPAPVGAAGAIRDVLRSAELP